MITEMYEIDDILHVRVGTLAELREVIKQHGGDEKSDFKGLPYGIDTDRKIIGETTCNDGVTICFWAPDAETAGTIWEEMF